MTGVGTQLNATLIVAPAIDAGLIERGRLSRRLDEGAQSRLISVCAPAGFGKTSMVAAWLHQRRELGARVAWLSLNEGHDNPRVLLRYLIAALRSSWTSIGEATLTLLNSNLPMTSTALATTLINELGAITEDTFLVLDDFHTIANVEAVLLLQEVIQYAPTHLHFILTSRARPDFPLGRLRELGALYEIPARDLEFSPAEVNAFLTCERIELNPRSAEALCRNTGGWAAGLKLAAICLRDESAPASFIESFSGGYTAIAEFLQEDVLSRQSPELQQFLLCTGLIDELTAPLCDFILERGDSRELLESVHDRGLFLFTIDARKERFRYHRLFADFLRHRVWRDEPQLMQAIHMRASAWYASAGAPVEAIDYALRAGDEDGAGHLLEAYSEAIFSSGQLELLRNLAARLPRRVLDSCPRLLLDLIWIHTLCWEITEAERLMARVKRRCSETAVDSAVPAAVHEKILHREIMIALLQDKLEEAGELWERWPTVTTGENDYFDGSAESADQIVRRERFEVRFVIAQAPRVRRRYIAAGTEYGTVWFDSLLGPAYLMSGELSKAESTLRGAVDVAGRISGPASPLVAMPSLLLADVLYERNDIQAAQAIVDTWLPQADRIGFVDQLIAGYVCAARLAANAGHHAASFAILDRGMELAAAYSFERFELHLIGERVRQLLLLNRNKDAREVVAASTAVKSRPFAPPGKRAVVSDLIVTLTHARLALGTGDKNSCSKVLKAWLHFLEGHACVREEMRLRVVLAAVQFAGGGARSAWRTLRQAIVVAAASGIVRPLLEERERTLAILDAAGTKHATAGDTLGDSIADLRRMLIHTEVPSAFSPAARSMANPPDTSVPSLTERERDILLGIADGSSSKELANRLGLSEATVKWHLQHVYEKLGVHRRVVAVRKARELGLIN